MELKVTEVSRCLDKKMMIMGFEIPDLLFIFLTMSILNFLFGTTNLKMLFVWLPSAAIALTIKLTKRGKPDNYLIHKIKFFVQPKYLRAFVDSHNFKEIPKYMRKG